MHRFPVVNPSSPKKAFSLVEVVFSLAVVSFALISLLGMLPVGLTTYRTAIGLTVQAQIAQSVSAEIQNMDYSKVVSTNFYFDQEGLPVSSASDPNRIYTAQVTPKALIAPIVFNSASCQNVLIQIISKSSPAQTYSASVVVANDNQ